MKILLFFHTQHYFDRDRFLHCLRKIIARSVYEWVSIHFNGPRFGWRGLLVQLQPYKRDIGSHKIQLAWSEYSEYSSSWKFSEYIRHIRYPFPANMPTQYISVVCIFQHSFYVFIAFWMHSVRTVPLVLRTAFICTYFIGSGPAVKEGSVTN